MVKIRKLASLEKGLEEITRILTEEEIKKAINKGSSYIRKCSDPDPDSDGIKRNIDHKDSVELDKACLLYTSPSPRDRTRSRMPSSA